MFFCCSEVESKEVYEMRTHSKKGVETKIFSSINLEQHRKLSPDVQILKIQRSDYAELVKKYKGTKQLWEDIEFPPNDTSLGKIEGVTCKQWKRLSKIAKNPTLFDGRIEPQDVIQGSLGDCYFLSAVAALAEKESRIRAIFGDQQFNQNGIYKVTLRISGVVQEIVVDDNVPVNSAGEPIFCQPNKNEFWVPILEKAWAKANGSYANIVAGSPVELFKAAVYAPAETIFKKEGKDQEQKLWKMILANAKKDSPCCCGTSQKQTIDWSNIGLVPGHAYTLINAAELQDKVGNIIRVLKLRNPWGNTEWGGEGNEADARFWGSMLPTEEKIDFLKGISSNNDGIFYMTFSDYLKHFQQTHICFMEETGNYVYDNFSPNPKSGSYWSVNIFQEGDYFIELHQGSARLLKDEENSLCRGTLMLAKDREKDHELVGGIMTYYEEDTTLKVRLTPGKYTLFAKLEASISEKKVPQVASVSIYSLQYAVLELKLKDLCNSLLLNCFRNHAAGNKRKKYENDTMWISWKMMFREGGYAYIAFGVEREAVHKFQISFSEADFCKSDFKLKKPLKGRGEVQLEVGPGEVELVLCRIANKNVKNLKFPPPIHWKVVGLA